jgi:Luciferase-like monooxygenase
MTTRRLRFGIKTAPQHTTYDDIRRVWEEADAIPIIEHAWVFDHFVPLGTNPAGPCLEGWTLLAALAARTDRLRVGVMVTGNTYRHPAVLANMGATVDALSHGRLDLGIGAGWHEQEHAMYGIPLYAPGERIRRLGEACDVIKRLWTEPVATYDGQSLVACPGRSSRGRSCHASSRVPGLRLKAISLVNISSNSGHWSAQNPELQMGGDRSFDERHPLELDRAGAHLRKQSGAATEEHRFDVDAELVDQAQLQRLVCGAGTSCDVHVFVASGRLRLDDRSLDVGDERKRSSASNPDLAWPMRRYEDRHLERRILAPAVYVVVHSTTGDDRAGLAQHLVDH